MAVTLVADREVADCAYCRVSEDHGAPPVDHIKPASRQPSTPRNTRPKKRRRRKNEEEDQDKMDVVTMLVEGLKDVARILGQNVSTPSELEEEVDDLEIEIEELQIDVKEVLAMAGRSPKLFGVDWLDTFKRPHGAEVCGGKPDDAVKS